MRDDIDLQGEDWEQQLQSALAELPAERAPRRLRRTLRRIPRENRAPLGFAWLNPGWAFALLLVPLTLLVYLQGERLDRQEQEIAQGQRDLAVALEYIDRANRSAGEQVKAALNSGFTGPVTDQTLQALQQPLEKAREYEL